MASSAMIAGSTDLRRVFCVCEVCGVCVCERCEVCVCVCVCVRVRVFRGCVR